MQFQTLPYDLLFHIAQYLDVDDVHNLQAVCSMHAFPLEIERLTNYRRASR